MENLDLSPCLRQTPDTTDLNLKLEVLSSIYDNPLGEMKMVSIVDVVEKRNSCTVCQQVKPSVELLLNSGRSKKQCRLSDIAVGNYYHMLTRVFSGEKGAAKLDLAAFHLICTLYQRNA